MAIKTLIVGFGYAAQTFHLPFLRCLNAFNVDAVVSSDAAKVNAILPECRVYGALDDAIHAQHFDLIIVTTPNLMHGHQARKALEANSHVLVEKPFVLSVTEANELVALAESRQLKLCAFHNRRFDGDFITVCRLLASNKLGDVKHIVSRFDRFRPQPKNRWRENADAGSGIFWDLGPHLIDQAVALLGKPQKISGYLHTQRENGQSTDNFELTLHYPDLNYHVGSSCFQANETLRFEVRGTQGSYRQFGLDSQEDQLKNGISPSAGTFGLGAREGELCSQNGCETVTLESGRYIQFYKQLAYAIDGGQPPPISTHDMLASVEILAGVVAVAEANEGHVLITS
ncbi:Gfo/Idh/MocA family protein [Alteromonas ponticola]|uniref:Gfo/Idh/MocA family oxidoreductase n=1 Tax=Alteromonas ponticola TaxID=2720613 RepID=A0ABX1R6I1_9ALTE|nr:Gfo/Idh/MocA family oxidoreductase [Alteromonas ponticola]NMH60838.1 Gfo/Idh/MocA family oxidoreductase [Alteromonas ponticola]